MQIVETLRYWALSEHTRWVGNMPLALERCKEEKVAKCETVYRVDIGPAGAAYRPKANTHKPFDARIQVYEDFLQHVCESNQIEPTSILVDVDDECDDHEDVPVFSFQKRKKSPNLLLPDIDFLLSDFYKDVPLDDTQPTNEKLRSAIFVGSTTGAGRINHHKLDSNAVPRIRLARFAKNHPRIIVRLPNIVQYQDFGIVERLRAEGFGGPMIAWKDQLLHKFLISIDGNGAACSRVYLALISNCVLVKYRSDHELHYFRGICKNMHYIEVCTDENLLEILEWDDLKLSEIAEAGRNFAELYLNKPMLEVYTAYLLSEYAQLGG